MGFEPISNRKRLESCLERTLHPSQCKKDTDRRPFCIGWGAGIRTPEMSESESDALPLGDTPIFSTLCIITEKNRFVNTYFKLFLKNYSFFTLFLKNIRVFRFGFVSMTP